MSLFGNACIFDLSILTLLENSLPKLLFGGDERKSPFCGLTDFEMGKVAATAENPTRGFSPENFFQVVKRLKGMTHVNIDSVK